MLKVVSHQGNTNRHPREILLPTHEDAQNTLNTQNGLSLESRVVAPEEASAGPPARVPR